MILSRLDSRLYYRAESQRCVFRRVRVHSLDRVTQTSSYLPALGSTVAELKQNFPSSTPIHPKTRFSMVLPSGETDEFLQSKNIKNIMIVGIESHVCVLQTSLDLLGRGYGVWILRDCVSSCNKEEVPIAIEVR